MGVCNLPLLTCFSLNGRMAVPEMLGVVALLYSSTVVILFICRGITSVFFPKTYGIFSKTRVLKLVENAEDQIWEKNGGTL